MGGVPHNEGSRDFLNLKWQSDMEKSDGQTGN